MNWLLATAEQNEHALKFLRGVQQNLIDYVLANKCDLDDLVVLIVQYPEGSKIVYLSLSKGHLDDMERDGLLDIVGVLREQAALPADDMIRAVAVLEDGTIRTFRVYVHVLDKPRSLYN